MTKKQYILAAIILVAISAPKIAFSASREELGEALLLAAKQNKANRVAQLLTQGADINYTNRHKCNALYISICRQTPDIIKMLLSSGINVNHVNRRQKTALATAILWSNIDTIKALLNVGANPLSSSEIKAIDRHQTKIILQLQNKISKERRELLGQWCEYIDEEYDVPPVIQQLIVRDMLGTVPEQMPAL